MSDTAPDAESQDVANMPRHESSPAAQISNLVVGLLRSYTGRGPTRAWTSIDGDLVSVVLRDALTTGEKSLVADGRSGLVLDVRKAYQMTMRADCVAGVEAITGRTVIAFLSDNHLDPDVAVENFILEPRSRETGHPADSPMAGAPRDTTS
jgi:uncharacterized protein YbcI